MDLSLSSCSIISILVPLFLFFLINDSIPFSPMCLLTVLPACCPWPHAPTHACVHTPTHTSSRPERQRWSLSAAGSHGGFAFSCWGGWWDAGLCCHFSHFTFLVQSFSRADCTWSVHHCGGSSSATPLSTWSSFQERRGGYPSVEECARFCLQQSHFSLLLHLRASQTHAAACFKCVRWSCCHGETQAPAA